MSKTVMIGHFKLSRLVRIIDEKLPLFDFETRNRAIVTKKSLRSVLSGTPERGLFLVPTDIYSQANELRFLRPTTPS
jgi:hypothetical protein